MLVVVEETPLTTEVEEAASVVVIKVEEGHFAFIVKNSATLCQIATIEMTLDLQTTILLLKHFMRIPQIHKPSMQIFTQSQTLPGMSTVKQIIM